MLRVVVLSGLVMVLAAPAYADDEKPAKKAAPEIMFKKLDANGDGKVSKDEFTKFAEQNPKLKDKPGAVDKIFSKLDANGDGFLSLDEFKKLSELRKKKDK